MIKILDELQLPKGEWVVFGGACLTAHDIRDTSDLELFVTPRLFKQLKEQGWEERITNSTDALYVTKIYHEVPILAFIQCGSHKWVPNVASYLADPVVIDGHPFMSLHEMYEWKKATARPKDKVDVRLIEEHMKRG
ncbi:hypothetical protein CYG49_03740 [Candidatus Saccharibacteria bacterium]|nr:MAG: hypothetical protein CYG49_03740 [Candidatus Saccharibacteria bacterium]